MSQRRNSIDAGYAASEETREINEPFGRRPVTRSQAASEAQVRRRSDITVMLSSPSRQEAQQGSPRSPETSQYSEGTRRNTKRSIVDIQYFAGRRSDDVNDWLEHWELAARVNDWDAEDELRRLPLYLKDNARRWFARQSEELKGNLDQLKNRLEDYFNNEDMRLLARGALAERKQRPRESVNEYAEAVETLARKGFPADRFNEAACEAFINGLKPEIKQWLWGRRLKEFEDAVLEAQTREMFLDSESMPRKTRILAALEEMLHEDSEGEDYRISAHKQRKQTMAPVEKQQTQGNDLNSIWKAIGQLTEDVRRLAATNSTSVAAQYATKPRIAKCWICGKPGHVKRSCPEAKRQNRENGGD
ncbi:uncharacterized protein LOC135693029 [Rhopilema esculentum]|uniref:uncharacterized protein LOC135693029 n=1 Tax=Rhopilema esculentum TaxID=499914 RepID=UPI0031D3C8BA|eukprot:gene9753-18267_t